MLLANSIALALEVAERMAEGLHDKLEINAPAAERFGGSVAEEGKEDAPCASPAS